MKNILKIFILSLVFLFASCKEEAEKPKVIYDNAAKAKAPSKADTTDTEVADLPIHMEGTNYLIFPIGNLKSTNRGVRSSSYESQDSFIISNYGEYEITGYLQNLKFQEIGRDTITALTDKPVLIQTATYLKSVSEKIKQQLLVYTLADMDTNKDNKLDTNDIKSLYISAISGHQFTKLSPDFQELIDWNLIAVSNKLYFRTIEDTSKNGEFEKEDVLHYYFVNLLDKGLKAQEYKPL
jgi:hypothetical protein